MPAGRPRTLACKWGHEWTPDNTYVKPSGQRVCRTCKAQAKKARYEFEKRMRHKAKAEAKEKAAQAKRDAAEAKKAAANYNPLAIDPALKAKYREWL